MSAWIGWLTRFWHARQRATDISILWPSCKKAASPVADEFGITRMNMDHAKAAFAQHCFQDEAWLSLGEDEIKRIIGGLK